MSGDKFIPKEKHPSTPFEEPTSSITVEQNLYSGPIPSAQELTQYNAINPQIVQWFMERAEKEQNERWRYDFTREQNNFLLAKKEQNMFRLGQFLAITAVMLVVGLCAFGFYLGYPVQTAVIATGCIAAVVYAFYSFKTKYGNTSTYTKTPSDTHPHF